MDKTDIVPMGLQHHSIVGVDNYPNTTDYIRTTQMQKHYQLD